MQTATIQVPAFQEGSDMIPVLDAIRAQEPPAGWQVNHEVWVTLSPKQKCYCTTWQAARAADGWDVFEAPEGKLSARNAAHQHAVERGDDVVITWDADAPPLRKNTLRSLLAPFDDGDVAAVNSFPVTNPGVLGLVGGAAALVEDVARPHMHGQLSAFTSDAWHRAGPFEESIDQTEIDQVRAEEEFGFYQRLQECGRVTTAYGAAVLNDDRRMICKFNRAFDRFGHYPKSEWCEQRGIETFETRE